MIYRSCLSLLLALAVSAMATAQESSSVAPPLFQSAWKLYLTQTVRRGLPVLQTEARVSVVPYWPSFHQALDRALQISPSADVRLLRAYCNLQELQGAVALGELKTLETSPELRLFSPLRWMEAYLVSLRWAEQLETFQAAWLSWRDKYLSPMGLLTGLEVLSQLQPETLSALLTQARALYPFDRRFLPLLLQYDLQNSQLVALVTADQEQNGPMTTDSLARILREQPEAESVLRQSGYDSVRLNEAQATDYEYWLRSGHPEALKNGVFSWQSKTGGPRSTLVYSDGQLQLWTILAADPEQHSQWLTFEKGKPISLREQSGSQTWVLEFSTYPAVQRLVYSDGTQQVRYTFPPAMVRYDLAPQERFQGPEALWPAQITTQWHPLAVDQIVPQAALVETFHQEDLRQRLHLTHGQVWLTEEDVNQDGQIDSWSYFEQGQLSAVYQNFTGPPGGASTWELYQQGKLKQVLVDRDGNGITDFALFPQEQVQLWDLQQTGKPLLRVFQWDSDSRLRAFVFTGKNTTPAEPRWQTMPLWEPRP